MKVMATAICAIVLAGSAQPSRLRVCDEMGRVARVITERRDAGINASTLRELNDHSKEISDEKALVDALITEIYSDEGRGLGPDDIAARVIDGCLSD